MSKLPWSTALFIAVTIGCSGVERRARKPVPVRSTPMVATAVDAPSPSGPSPSGPSPSGPSPSAPSLDLEPRTELAPLRDDWNIALFAGLTEAEIASERAFYDRLETAWAAGDRGGAFAELSARSRERPAHRELRLLQAAVVLDAWGALDAPTQLLAGELAPDELTDPALRRNRLDALRFAAHELARALPFPPPVAVPWSGLYHPYALEPLLGEYATLWAIGVPLFVRRLALEAGDVALYEELTGEPESLLERVRAAQLAAVRGDERSARRFVEAPLEELVAPEYVATWRGLLAALTPVLVAAGDASPEAAATLFAAWERGVIAKIPPAVAASLALSAAVVRAARSSDRAAGAAGSLPSEEALLAEFPRRPRDGAPAAPRQAIIAAAKRWHDVRADTLHRLALGKLDALFAADLTVGEERVGFTVDGRERMAFFWGAAARALTAVTASGVRIACRGRAALWIR